MLDPGILYFKVHEVYTTLEKFFTLAFLQKIIYNYWDNFVG